MNTLKGKFEFVALSGNRLIGRDGRYEHIFIKPEGDKDLRGSIPWVSLRQGVTYIFEYVPSETTTSEHTLHSHDDMVEITTVTTVQRHAKIIGIFSTP